MNKTKRFSRQPVLLALAVCLMSSRLFWGNAEATLIVVPSSAGGSEGSIANGFPFNLAAVPLSSQRYQQVYAASEFAALSPNGALITQILFRPDGGGTGAAFTSTLPSIRIDLSTTSAAPDALNSTFASNVGLDNTIVFGGLSGAALPLSSAFTGPPGGPKDFDIVINLTTAFFYNPLLGNLLLDVRNFGGGLTTQFDAIGLPNDSISRAYTGSASDVNSPNADGTVGLTTGLVTGFTTVPEMSSAALVAATLGIGIGARVLFQRRRVSRAT